VSPVACFLFGCALFAGLLTLAPLPKSKTQGQAIFMLAAITAFLFTVGLLVAT
jgi:hypothetical protein